MARPSTPFLKWMTALGLLMIVALTLGALRAQEVCDEFMQASGKSEYASVPLCLAELSGLRTTWNRLQGVGQQVSQKSKEVLTPQSPSSLPSVVPPPLPEPQPTKWTCTTDEECTLTGCCGWGRAMLRENYRTPKECETVRCIPSPHRAVCMRNHCAKWTMPERETDAAPCSAENCVACAKPECEQLSDRCEIASRLEGSKADDVDSQKRKEGKPSLQVYSYSCKSRT